MRQFKLTKTKSKIKNNHKTGNTSETNTYVLIPTENKNTYLSVANYKNSPFLAHPVVLYCNSCATCLLSLNDIRAVCRVLWRVPLLYFICAPRVQIS